MSITGRHGAAVAALAVVLLAGATACAHHVATGAPASASIPAAPAPSPVVFTGPLPTWRPS